VAARRFPAVLQNYERWHVLTEPGSWDTARMRNAARHLDYKPKVSILLPVYNPEPAWLERCLDSVMAQTYPHWELCVCDDGSTKPHVGEILDLYERIEDRIKVKRLEENENIVGATNHALTLATAEWVGLLDHDDELAPHALFEMVKFLRDHRDADLVYSDEDKIDEAGVRMNPHFKTGWSHDLAMEANYLCHFSVYRKTLLEELGGWREGFDGAQDLELVQRVGEKTDRIYHLPKMLYHWRMVTGSTAVGAEGKPYTHEKARRAIQDSLERQGIAGTVEDSGFMPNTFRVRREIVGQPKVSVISWSPGDPDRLLKSLREKTAYKDHEVLVLDTKNATLKGAKTEKLSGTHLAELLNEAVRRADGEYVALLGPGLEAASGDWLESMLQHAQREEVGVVGGKLTLPSGEVYGAGLILADDTENGRPLLYRNCDRRAVGYDLYFALNRNCSAVSSRCMMFRKETFEGTGGFDDLHFDDAFADVDLCLRMRERGLLVVCTPYANFTYHGPPDGQPQPGPDETEYARRRWGGVLRADPYHNPNLAWDPEDLDMMKGRPFHDPKKAAEAKKDSAVPAVISPRKSVEIPSPFFVVGHGRSGTTWLELTLNSHPEVVCKGSGMFFGRDMPLYEGQATLPAALEGTGDLKIWHDMRPNYWSKRSFEEDLPRLTKAIADYTMGAELAASGKKLAGDRTPHHVSYLDELHALYPEAKVVHVIRDGRDVAISNLHAIWQNARDRSGPVDLEPEVQEKRDAYLADREGFVARGESIFTDYRIEQLAGSWRDVVSKGREDGERLFGERYFEVRYEDLLDDPAAELGRLLAFLGVDHDPEMVSRIAEDNSFERVTGRKRGEEDPAHFNRKGVAGEWKKVFTDRDRRVFEERAGALLAELGYEQDGTSLREPNKRGSAKVSAPSAPKRLRSRENPPFFVVGHGRSGTTWSERLLNSHPEVLCVGSGMFFGRDMGLFEGRKTLHWTLARSEELETWHRMQPNYWSGYGFEAELPGMVKAITDQVIYSALDESEEKIVGDRTPHHVSYLEEIHALYPGSKIIHVIRDGRDVAISNVHAFWNSARDRGGPVDLEPEELALRDAYLADREGFLKSGQSIFTEQRINRLAKGWKQVVGRGSENGRRLFGGNYLEVRYEALLTEPVAELTRVFSLLGVSTGREVLDRIVAENAFEKKSGRSRGEEDTTSFFRKGISGDWKGVFNGRDRKVFKRHAGDLLVDLGYEEGLDW
jgi:GT2 family glycosyltransferase